MSQDDPTRCESADVLEEVDTSAMEDISGGCQSCGCQNQNQGSQSKLMMLLPLLMGNNGSR
jgi:hypothetical protein